MATKLETMDLASRSKGALGRAASDEPVFVLRAQDCLSAEIVEKWALRARAMGVNTDKVSEAFDCAERMRDWHTKKVPD